MTEIKPCPHCGSEGEIIERNNPMSKWRWSVDCASTTCGASGPVEATPAESLAAWNTRTPDPSLIAGLREAREALERQSRNFDLHLAGRPVRDVAEMRAETAATLARLDNLLSQEGQP